MLRPTVSRPVCPGVKPHLRPKTRFLLLSDSCGFVDVGRPLWRGDGPVVYNCCWPSPALSFSGASPTGFMAIFCCLRFETPPNWRARSPYIYPSGTRWASYTRGTGFPSRRLLGLERLRWRYSKLHPHRPWVWVWVLCYDRQSVGQSVLA
jgi:hypothetical protein